MNRRVVITLGILTAVIIFAVIVIFLVLPAINRNKCLKEGGTYNSDTKQCTAQGEEEDPDTTEPKPPTIDPAVVVAMDKVANTMFWKNPPAPSNALLLTVDSARTIAKKIKDAIGYVWDNETTIVNEIKKLKTKSQASFVNYYFVEQTGGMNMIPFIKGEVNKSNNLQQIEQHILRIPDYTA